jgi:hypothetical protein
MGSSCAIRAKLSFTGPTVRSGHPAPPSHNNSPCTICQKRNGEEITAATQYVGVEVHTAVYEELCLLGYSAMWSYESQLTFWRNMSPSPSELKSRSVLKMKVTCSWKCWLGINGLHGFTFQKTELFLRVGTSEAIKSYKPQRTGGDLWRDNWMNWDLNGPTSGPAPWLLMMVVGISMMDIVCRQLFLNWWLVHEFCVLSQL